MLQNRCDFGDDILAHPLDDDYHRARSADWDKITVPSLSAANWGGQGLHPRGNFEGFMRAASKHKWLEVHGIEHWTHFYTDYGVKLQKRFFDHFLKGEDNGWDEQPRVQLQVRHPSTASSSGTRTSGRSRARSGPSSTSIRRPEPRARRRPGRQSR